MELRIKSARTTKDIDLTLRGVGTEGASGSEGKRTLERLQEVAGVDMGDFFVYTVGESISDLDGAPYGGARFPVEARMDGRNFVGFHVDVGIGDAVMEPLEIIEGRNWLQFAGIANPSLFVISREQQFAEKLHAYTLPRRAVNSRVRDLVDMVLLIQSGKMVKEKVAEAVRVTFDRRRTHLDRRGTATAAKGLGTPLRGTCERMWVVGRSERRVWNCGCLCDGSGGS